jgi:hypothetical protein
MEENSFNLFENYLGLIYFIPGKVDNCHCVAKQSFFYVCRTILVYLMALRGCGIHWRGTGQTCSEIFLEITYIHGAVQDSHCEVPDSPVVRNILT